LSPVGAFLGQPAHLNCPLTPAAGVKMLYWMTPLGDRISADSVTNAGYIFHYYFAVNVNVVISSIMQLAICYYNM